MIQLQVLNAILNRQDPSLIVNNGLDSSYFSNYINEFNFIKDHLDMYKNVPDKATFLDKFPEFPSIIVNESDEYLISELCNDKINGILSETFNSVREKVLSNKTADAVAELENAKDKLVLSTKLKTIDLLKDIDERYNIYIERCNNKNDYYVDTGFKELNAIIGGWDRTEELATIAARTNQGKSWILFKFAAAAVRQGLRVGIYEGEMSSTKVGYRFDTSMNGISNYGLTHGNFALHDTYKIYLDGLLKTYPTACCKVLTPIMIGGPAGISKLRAFIETEKLDILFVDQHSLLDDDRHAKNPIDRASNISKDLKNLQVMEKIPIIAVSQQNRASTENGVGTEHIAQSDRIAQDSTIVLFFEQDKDHKLLTMSLVKSRDSENNKKLQYEFNFDTGFFRYIPQDGEDTTTENTNEMINQLKNEFEADEEHYIPEISHDWNQQMEDENFGY